MNLSHLNNMQRRAVEHTEGPLLVLAGAGSGKTRVLTHRIAYLVEEKGVSPYNLLAITFTNKAAREMKERLESLMEEGCKDLWVSTFHSACMRMLRMDIEKIGYQKNFVIYDTADQLTVMKDCIKKLSLDEKYFNPRAVLGAIGKAKDQLIGPEEFTRIHGSDFRDAKIGELYKMYQKTLKNNNALDFDDLIMKTVELFNQNPAVLHYYHNKFKYILVDEFQDTNMAQYTLVSMLAKQHKNLCVVGDDDQSIYGWRGADIQNILGFEKDFPGAAVVKLEENYRSTKTILEAANRVVVNNEGRKDKKLWTGNDEGEIIQYYKANNEYDEASYIANCIETLRKEKYPYSNFAILYRTNAQSRVLEEELMKQGVPYKIFSGTRFYDRKEIKDILAYLTTVENPVDDISVKRIINVPKRGIGLKTIEKIEAYGEKLGIRFFEALLDIEEMGDISGRVQKQIKKFTDMIIDLRERKEEMKVTEIVEELYKKTGYIDALKEEDRVEADTRIENLYEFLSLTVDFDENAEVKTLEEFLARTSLESSLDSDNEEEDAVVLMTLHSAKGLEFPVVFMPGMEEGIFPSYMSMQEKNEEEERRLCYVGITRAMKKLYMSHAMMRTLYGRTSYNSCSRFLEEIPQELIAKEKAYKRKEEVKKMQTSPLFTGGGLSSFHDKPKLNTTVIKKKVNAGDKVKHPTFGIGTVVSAGGDILTIAFPSAGVKKISSAFVQLDVVE
ncbi:DNA helicase PcrA [Clostridium formicaceticum]|uniref:ATP-dependent DNA helicase n=1 Tax=Clostridium formicaceticum TaxID=1497 RepID=A0AAC9RKW6_9CLOT|nr:DNA helicase PcrA [Clostridium formicaceticum]AOY75820.1 ATP-dependent DNA helicase PcrA [Clostridium formicaceticum]ARE86150.1 ATP-dependent DNA helicase PcrA [Clostridium formicaceticum]